MKTKFVIVPILMIALVGLFAAPPVEAELVTLTIILAAAFTTAIVANETLNSDNENLTASTTEQSDSYHQANSDFSGLSPVNTD